MMEREIKEGRKKKAYMGKVTNCAGYSCWRSIAQCVHIPFISEVAPAMSW